MKEMPEKIYVYIPDDDTVGTASLQKGFPHQFVTEEYTRTDAFIEKACDYERGWEDAVGEILKWLRNNYRNYMHNPTGEKLEAFFGGDMITDLEKELEEGV